jgi:uncharacterized CHY-type Zn-finger protein
MRLRVGLWMVEGLVLDRQTRCLHYHGAKDVIAIRPPGAESFFACLECHQARTGTPQLPWALTDRSAYAVLCGVCGCVMRIEDYRNSGSKCPHCQAAFNPGCQAHWPLYFGT